MGQPIVRLELDLTPIDQRPNGCWAACIATITGISLDDLAQPFSGEDGEEWVSSDGVDRWQQMQDWLVTRGWSLFHTYGRIPRGYAIACGQSPRGHYHAVVMKDGALWHDPHPSRAGLVKVEHYEYLMPIVGTINP